MQPWRIELAIGAFVMSRMQRHCPVQKEVHTHTLRNRQ